MSNAARSTKRALKHFDGQSPQWMARSEEKRVLTLLRWSEADDKGPASQAREPQMCWPRTSSVVHREMTSSPRLDSTWIPAWSIGGNSLGLDGCCQLVQHNASPSLDSAFPLKARLGHRIIVRLQKRASLCQLDPQGHVGEVQERQGGVSTALVLCKMWRGHGPHVRAQTARRPNTSCPRMTP